MVAAVEILVEEILVVEIILLLPLLQQHVRTASEWLVRLQMYLVVAAVVERISALVELVEHVPQLTNSPIKGYMEVAALDLV